MGVLGREEVHKLVGSLDPALLVRLARDLLICRGHERVRITDGPGDGGRDIHSIIPDGDEMHITQSKHHADAEATCSSAEVSELPMALVKFGCRHGLFVTNAKISPQAKREYLNDYPSLILEFLDGAELCAEVMRHAILKALWFDGERLRAVNVRAVIPILVRLHRGDAPMLPLRYPECAKRLRQLVSEIAARHGVLAQVVEATSSTEPFAPYRFPYQRTVEEGASPLLHMTEVSLKGRLTLHELAAIVRRLASELASSLSSARGANLTVVTGRPFVTPLEGADVGGRMLTTIDRAAFVGINGIAESEWDWFAPIQDKWQLPPRVTTLTAEWVRLWNPKVNAAVRCDVETPVAGGQLLLDQLHRRGWMGSLFALVPSWEGDWEFDAPAPSEFVEWPYDGRRLCGWFHRYMLSGLISIPGDRGPEEEAPLPGLDVDESEEADRLAKIAKQINAIAGATPISAEKARHMVALIAGDPLDDQQPMLFRFAELLANFQGLASPIDPASRTATITFAWLAANDAVPVVRTFVERVGEALRGAARVFADQGCLVGDVSLRLSDSCQSTRSWLASLAQLLEGLVASEPQANGVQLERATKKYFWDAHEVVLEFPLKEP